MKLSKGTRFFLTTIFLSHVSLANATFSMAVGSRDTTSDNSNNSGIILFSNDDWKTWKYPSFPDEYLTAFNSVSCSGVTCVTVGRDQVYPSWGIMRITHDLGLTWETPALSNLPSEWSAVHCTDQKTCVVVGLNDYENAFQNLILWSPDLGAHWAFKDLQINLPITQLKMWNVINHDNQWFALNNYWLGDERSAGIVTSEDNGLTWKLETPFYGKNNAFYPTLENMSCNSAHCFAVGSLNTDKENFNSQRGIILEKGINADHWSLLFPIDDTSPSKLRDITCTNQFCIALGETKKTDEIEAMILVGDANGAGWKMQTPFSKISKARESHLTSVSCTDKTCVAVGYYNTLYDLYVHYGIVFISHDQGQNWTYTHTFPVPNFPDTTISKVTNVNQSISVIGHAIKPFYESTMPVIFASDDDGRTWEQRTPFLDYHIQYSRLNDVLIARN